MENFPLKTDLIQVKGKAKNGKVKVVKYDRSFIARLCQNEKAKRFYDELKNYCLSFEKVKARTAWGAESFSAGNETVVKLVVVGGALCACVALSPSAYNKKDYPHGDWSAKKEFAATPMALPVRSAQESKAARRLIAEAFTTRCVYTQEFPIWTDYVATLPGQKDDALIKKNLIKVTESEVSEADAKKLVAAALKQEAEEEKAIEEIGGEKKPRAPKKPKKEAPAQEAVAEVAANPAPAPEPEVEPAIELETEPTAEEPAKEEAPEEEEVVFELAEEAQPVPEEPEEVIFELAEPAIEEKEEPVVEDEVEECEFELAEPEPLTEPESEPEDVAEPKEAPASAPAEEEEEEDCEFELVPAVGEGMESCAKEKEEEELVTLKKYVRGFVAKMRQGDQERKDYYAEIKAKMLSYKGVRLLESFSGDGYKKGSRALLKIRIRGKTLCLFFALNPDDYKQTVYRQQFKGDTKAYAATPMMVRVKSDQGLKRALNLIAELERIFELKAGDPADLLSIRGSYLFEETEALVEKGLIKTRTVKVPAYEAERLLKKKIK